MHGMTGMNTGVGISRVADGLLNTVLLLSGTTYTVPLDLDTLFAVGCHGAGGNGFAGGATAVDLSTGGGGGAYAEINAITDMVAAKTYSTQIAAGGSQNDTWFKTTGTVLAKAGRNGTTSGGANGGDDVTSVGTSKLPGGSGNSNSADARNQGGGGGGACGGRGGGGGAAALSTGVDGGAGQTAVETSGGTGGAGGVNATPTNGAPGGDSALHTFSGVISNPGGGGGGGARTTNGGNGGFAGGGGGGCHTANTPGTGAQGLIIFTYFS